MPRGPWIDHFGDNFLWSNATLILKGMAPYGTVSLEEMDRACEKLRARQGEADRGKAWFEEWRALGDQIEKQGDAALARGGKMSAGDYYVRAGIYHYNAERFIAPGPEKKAQCAHAYKVWHQGIRLRHSNIEFVEVPYEGTTLPALFMKAPGAGPAPTVVVLNGMDNAKEMSVFFCGLEFARRGYNTLCLDGPGMGETRRMRDMPSRYDYEVPAGAALDYLLTRPEVDGKRVAIMGYSFGGYYSSRVAAFEKRYAACIALPRIALGSRRLAAEDQGRQQERAEERGAVELPVALGGRRQGRGRRHRDRQEILAQGRGEEHHLPVPGDARRQRPRGAGRERAEAL